MLILALVFLASIQAQQELCYEGPGDVYSGPVNVTDRGRPCENWDNQTLITLPAKLNHNYCRVLLQLSSRPYCIYGGQKQSCDIPLCDKATLLFDGDSMILFRADTPEQSILPIIIQQINFYFKVDTIQRSEAILVQVRSKNDYKQHLSVVLQNGFVTLLISLDSYNTERIVFGGPVSTGDVHYISVNRSRDSVYLTINQTIINHTLVNQDTTFLVAPYIIVVGENYYGCMTGLTVGSWVQRKDEVKLYTDKPLTYYTGYDVDDFIIRRTRKDSPQAAKCMYAPPTIIRDTTYVSTTIPTNTVEEAAVGIEKGEARGSLDTTSIIIISSALGIIFCLTAMVVICMKRNQHLYTPQGYNLEVM